MQSAIDGVPLTLEQLSGYCELLVEAGNETTRDAIAGAMQAFCELPDQWEKLRAHPELLPDAVEEILRWVTPINYFVRTATAGLRAARPDHPRRRQGGPVLGLG